jgi:hypothetical protein
LENFEPSTQGIQRSKRLREMLQSPNRQDPDWCVTKWELLRPGLQQML